MLRLLLLCLLPMSVWADGVILLHGIARSSASLAKMETALQGQGYTVLNLDYPARTQSLESIVEKLHPQIATFAKSTKGQVHFVTHSMGGLVTRAYLTKYRPENLGRVVMLAPPNGGSEVSDFLATNPAYKAYFGPAGGQLVTSPTAQLTATLGQITYPLGIIAGTRSVNLLSSWILLPGEDDGKVTLARTHIAGETAHLTLPVTHPFLMNNSSVISQTINFLQHGSFQ